jgi:hypothetical protein
MCRAGDADLNVKRVYAGRAMLTLFASATMENWVTVLVDVMGGDAAQIKPGVMFFFVSYIVLVGYVLTSVVVAVCGCGSGCGCGCGCGWVGWDGMREREKERERER